MPINERRITLLLVFSWNWNMGTCTLNHNYTWVWSIFCPAKLMMSLFKKQPWSKDYGQAHDRFYPHPRNYISSHQGRFSSLLLWNNLISMTVINNDFHFIWWWVWSSEEAPLPEMWSANCVSAQFITVWWMLRSRNRIIIWWRRGWDNLLYIGWRTGALLAGLLWYSVPCVWV